MRFAVLCPALQFRVQIRIFSIHRPVYWSIRGPWIVPTYFFTFEMTIRKRKAAIK